MFADERLSPAIHKALSINKHADFRLEMLRLVQQGKLKGCRDIVIEAALDRAADPYQRIVATDTLAGADDVDGLNDVATDIFSDLTPLPANLAPSLAMALFPVALNVDQLLQIIGTSQPARRYQIEGFNLELVALYERCCSEQDRQKLIAGLAMLALETPLKDWPAISKRNAVLASKFDAVAKAAVARSDSYGITEELLALLRVAGRARDDGRDEGPALEDMVAVRPALNEALFWHDVAAERALTHERVTKYRHVSPSGPPLWRIDPADTGWLIAALNRPDPDDRLVAIDTLIAVAFSDSDTRARLEDLQRLAANDPTLSAAVTEARTPRVETDADVERREKWQGYERARQERAEQRRERWRKLRTVVQTSPQLLSDPKRLRRWPGPVHLLEVTRWLTERSEHGVTGGGLNWRQLEAAFGADVAAAYREGMKTLWRVTKPQRPNVKSDGTRTVKYTIIMSMAGLLIEASERSDWAGRLTPAEAERASQHICLDDQAVPEGLGALLLAHPAIVAPIIFSEMSREWRSSSSYTPLLDRATRHLPIESLRQALLALLRKSSSNPGRIVTASDLVPRLGLTEGERSELADLAHRDMRLALKAGDEEMLGAQLRLLFRLAPQSGVTELINLVEAEVVAGNAPQAGTLLRRFFDRHHGSVVDPAILGPRPLGRLLELSYAVRNGPSRPLAIEVDDDEQDTDARSPDVNQPLNELLSALLKLNSEEAYRTMISLSEMAVVGSSSHRLRELAREIAERASERKSWNESLVVDFEASKLAPIRTGQDLLELTYALIDGINWGFAKADMSARAVVETAKDEASVQEWLGDLLQTLGGGRFRAHREAQVAQENRPDIIITATSAPVEVAIEVKHDEKGWTLDDLRDALCKQLAEQYLQPENRRHGALVITNHRDTKFWREMEKKVRLTFDSVIAILQTQASTIRSNSSGPIMVAVRGIDAAPGKRAVAETKDGRTHEQRRP